MSRGGVLVPLAIAAAVAVAVVAPDAFAGTSPEPSGEQTHPQVTPRVGREHRTFQLSFTLAQAPGRSGLLYTSYRAVVSLPAPARQSCSPTQPAPVTTGSQGEVERIALHPPARGWCKRQYEVTVYLQRRSVCGPPLESERRIACPVSAGGVEPAFPISDVNTGQTHFTVR